MNEIGAAPITVSHADAGFLTIILQGLANAAELHGPNRLTDEQIGLVAGPAVTIEGRAGTGTRQVVADRAREISLSLRNSLDGA